MNVISVMQKILFVANAMICEPTLPDLPLATKDLAQRMRVSAFDELNGMLQCDVGSGSHEQMNVLGHHDEGMQLKTPLAAIAI